MVVAPHPDDETLGCGATIYSLRKKKHDVRVIFLGEGSTCRFGSNTSKEILNKIGNTLLTSVFNLLFNTTFTDIYSCYFGFKKELLDVNKLKTEGFEQHAEILCKVIKNGNKFYEVPISYNGRTKSEGKKIKAYHFFIVLFEIIRGRIF